jgi:hypothetical protein
MDLCEQVGCEPYISANVGSGTVREMADWIEYITFDGASTLAEHRRAGGKAARFGAEAAALEQLYRDSPDSKSIAMQLAEAYARKVVGVRCLVQLRGLNLFEGLDPALRARWKANLDRMEDLIGSTGTQKELLATAARGEALARKLLKRDDLEASERFQAHLLLGQFLLAEGRWKPAEAEADRALEIEESHVSPHLLKAEIYQDAEQFDRAVEENMTALAKLPVWVREAPSLSQYVAWRMGSLTRYGADNIERRWRRKKEEAARAIRTGIQMHIQVLKLLEKAGSPSQ